MATAQTSWSELSFGQALERLRGMLIGPEAARAAQEEGLFVKAEDRLLFFEPFARMVNDGLPAVRALRAIAEYTTHPQLSILLRSIDEKIVGGLTLEQAMAAFPRTFDAATVSTVQNGAAAGSLGPALMDIVRGLKREVAIGRKITKAMIYPLIALLFTGASLAINLLFVTPKLKAIYAQIPPDKMPAATKLLLAMSDIYAAQPIVITGMILGGAVALYLWSKTFTGRRMVLQALGVIPIAKKVFEEMVMVGWLRDMARMTRNAKPAPAAAELILQGIDAPYLHTRYKDIHTDLVNGQPLSQAMWVSSLFPSELVVYIRSGEEAGNVPDMLLAASEYAADRAEGNVDKLIDLMPSFMILVVGGVVALTTLGQWQGIFALQRIAQQ